MTDDVDEGDTLSIKIHGYAATSASIDRETWERKDREERREWAYHQLIEHGDATDVAAVTVEDADRDIVEEDEW